jgi:hypothetical protein
MARQKPVKVVWRDSENKSRSKGFDLIPKAQKFSRALISEGFQTAIYVQGALFESDNSGSAKAYDPRYEIPY